MNNKRRNSEVFPITTAYEKRPRRTYTVQEKLEIIKLSEQGERNCDIARAFGIRESTLRTICSQADKIKATYTKLSSSSPSPSPPPSSSSKTPQVRTGMNLICDMEDQLVLWINEQNNNNNIGINTNMIRERAIRIYNELKINNNGVQGRPFLASDVWLERFRKRANLHNLITDNNTLNNNETITNEFPAILKKIIDEDGYQSKQVFCIDETDLYWKRIPCDETIINDNIEILKDHLSLLFCMNANGDYRLKPLVVYHIANPKVLDGYSKNHLPVVWHSNPQAKITTNIFVDYFCNCLTHELKDYCAKEGIPFKILLILSNTTSIQSSYLMDLSENIRVVFLPPPNNNNTTIHPFKQGVISAFKAHYIRRMYLKLIEIVDDDDELELTQFWCDFTIKNAIDLISEAWHGINSTYLNRAWRLLWPECVHDCKVFDFVDDLLETKKQLSVLIKEIGFKNVTNFNEFIDDDNDSDKNNNDSNGLNRQIIKDATFPQLRTLSVDMLNEAFDNIQNAIQIFDEYDPDRERSAKIIKNIDNAIQCYKQIYYEKKRKAKQLITSTTTNLSSQALFPITGVIKFEDCEDN